MAKKRGYEISAQECYQWNIVGQSVAIKWIASFFRRFFLFSSENGRRSVTSFPPFSLLHAMANRDSGTILLLHVVTSLDPLSSTLLQEPLYP